MKRITLLQRLRPEIKQSLEDHTEEYGFMVNSIYEKLGEVDVYQDLTMSTIYSIYLFGNVDMYKADVFDIRWGDNLFLENTDLTIETL
jgi:hypothetical protein|tara:strand:- start:810 stop:1073 length:264 start_codon:yes stop_codon:yes gene_type:complete